MAWTVREQKDHPVQPPFHRQVCHPLDQVDQGLIQPGLEHLWGWGIHDFSGPHQFQCLITL